MFALFSCVLDGHDLVAAPLSGGVEHSHLNGSHSADDGAIKPSDATSPWPPAQQLPIDQWRDQVEPRLKAGLSWSDNFLPRSGTDVAWVQIPSWLAGQWHIERARFYLDSGGAAPEAVNREDDTFGWQQDRLGNYWDVLRSPVNNVTEADDFYSRFIHYRQTASQKSAVQYELESDNIELKISKKNGRIITVRRRHDVYAWLCVAANSGAALTYNVAAYTGSSVQANDHVRFTSIDKKGHVDETGSGTVRSRPQKVGPFIRVDVAADGFKARDSFKAFLLAHGRTDLVPDN